MTYPNNVSEKVELIAMPCPVFEDGEKLVMQRGAGVCTVKSTEEKTEACITFLKWLTDAQHNVDFVTSVGYMPVKTEAFEKYLPDAIENLTDPKYVSLYNAIIETQQEYTFYNAPKLECYLDLETRFEEQVRSKLTQGRNAFLNKEGSVDELVKTTLENFKKDYIG